jgi:hypothetical protein
MEYGTGTFYISFNFNLGTFYSMKQNIFDFPFVWNK